MNLAWQQERDLGLILNHKLTVNQQCDAAAKKLNAILELKEGIVLLLLNSSQTPLGLWVLAIVVHKKQWQTEVSSKKGNQDGEGSKK